MRLPPSFTSCVCVFASLRVHTHKARMRALWHLWKGCHHVAAIAQLPPAATRQSELRNGHSTRTRRARMWHVSGARNVAQWHKCIPGPGAPAIAHAEFAECHRVRKPRGHRHSPFLRHSADGLFEMLVHARMHLRAAGECNCVVRACRAPAAPESARLQAHRRASTGPVQQTCASGPVTSASVPQLSVPSCPSWAATPRPHVSTLPHLPAPAMTIVCP